MSKDELLLKILSSAWGCINDGELRDMLHGATGIDPAEVKKHYPKFDSFDPDDDDSEDNESEVSQNISNDVDDLVKRFKQFLTLADSYNNTFVPSK